MIKDAEKNLNLSELLRYKRLSASFSLEDIEAKTGIKLKNLKALEAGNFHDLPAPVYVQGYLKTLCKIYGLEFSKTISLYQEEENLRKHTQTDSAALQPQALSGNTISLTPKNLATASMGLVFTAIAIYMLTQIGHVTAAPSLQLQHPEEGLKISQNFIEVTGKTEPGSTLSINNQAIPLGNDGTFKQIIYLDLGENQIVVRAANRFSKYTEVSRRIVVGTAPQVLGEHTEQTGD
ncbi:MAG: hypothetical protein A3J48_00235 [Candidatus Doudnabacteria bacterium RIFCSPHIGHO2_02_FULL_46_11]|uniref:HTH cro/C1-type domain-containing protein n=1 Tax=Candidatus Doudnabacteria bacterium RIFCSPHIGHO2_02_FULL_46_11 TaxID=1817832 RepID=A0A1F5P6G9_9BACT|nr:MAG: hypothetical protein A3J48_00235 [Candidatus Doudnabacteria bacterium RIFCSPHIGHO2_02_FULL_46_11]